MKWTVLLPLYGLLQARFNQIGDLSIRNRLPIRSIHHISNLDIGIYGLRWSMTAMSELLICAAFGFFLRNSRNVSRPKTRAKTR